MKKIISVGIIVTAILACAFYGGSKVNKGESIFPSQDATPAKTMSLRESAENVTLINYNHPCKKTGKLCNIYEMKNSSYGVKDTKMQLCEVVMPPLNQMMIACQKANSDEQVVINSAYRSAEYQQQVYDEEVQSYGKEYADAYVSKPGYSEHQSGLAIDFGVMNSSGECLRFKDSGSSEWMEENSYRFGFIKRYPGDKESITHINEEAWHYRYVGVKAATYMYKHGMCLEEYLAR